ncbi:DinB family protein [candidate division GN15 bacterium]|nr:DinB family protein [candidate division GN15 bacterium]
MPDKPLREHLIDLLTARNAHVTFDDVIDNFPSEHYSARVGSIAHTPWQLLEHMRIAQWDILEFSRNDKHESPAWPEGYWPGSDTPKSDSAWDESVAGFRDDLEQFVALIRDDGNDLYEAFPHGDGQTLLREALVLAKHNSYHLGQLMMIRKAMEK